MRNIFYLLISLAMVNQSLIQAQAIYVDSRSGNDSNPGTKEAPLFSIRRASEIIKARDNNIYTIRINPGIYILDGHIDIETEKDMEGRRIVVEAAILPDDPEWTPEKMPVITSCALKGEITFSSNFVVSFMVEESHVTIRGIKFHGYFYPHTRYFPVARINKATMDLLVQQCMFVGDANVSQIQAGVVAHGDEVVIDHCVFYKLRNTVVFFQDSGNGIKSGNGITNSIIYGAADAVWTVATDRDFVFDNNIVTGCRYVWPKNSVNKTKEYSISNSIIVDNKYYTGVTDSVRLNPAEFRIKENNVIREGEISLRLTGIDERPFLDEVDKPLPVDYMHIIPGTLGYEMGAGLFIKKD